MKLSGDDGSPMWDLHQPPNLRWLRGSHPLVRPDFFQAKGSNLRSLVDAEEAFDPMVRMGG